MKTMVAEPAGASVDREGLLAGSVAGVGHNSGIDTEGFARDGFTVLKGVFTPDEIDRMRLVFLQQFQTEGGFAGRIKTIRSAVIPDVFNRDPRIAAFVLQPRILEALNVLIGRPVHYLHHSDIHMNWSGGWHRDSIDKPSYYDFVKTDPWAEENWADYSVYKVAVYLQDHRFNTEGFNLVPGSHRIRSTERPNEGALRSAIGDVLIFDTRLVHRGVLSHELESSKSFIDGVNRMSIFSSYGADNAMSREFSEGTVWRQNMQRQQEEYVLNPGLKAILEERGVGILPIETKPFPKSTSSLYTTMM
jgi:hypothetical protein